MNKTGDWLQALPLLMAAALPQAVAASEVSEIDFLDEVPIVLSASRLRQNVADAPAAVTVIDRQMIRDSGAWSIPDLFRLVPGMYVGESGDRGAFIPNSVVSYHGLSDAFTRRMQVLVDGRSIYSPLFGGAVWSTLPLALEDIERIEVIRGPNSATYGANSFLGVINIISRHPSEAKGGMVSLTQSNRGSDRTFRWGGQAGALDYRFTVGEREDRGITQKPGPDSNHRNVRERHDDKRLENFSFHGDLPLGQGDSLEIQAGLSRGRHQSGQNRELGDTNYSPEHERQVESHYGLLRWQRQIAAEEQVAVKFYANRDSQNFDLSRLVRPDFGVVPTPFRSPLRLVGERYDLEAQHTLAPAKNARLVWGGGLRLDRFASRFHFNSDRPESFRQANLFANLEWRPHASWVVNGGMMLENNSYSGTYFSPRLAANYRFLPGQTLRLSASRATHTPVMLEARGDSRWTFPLPPPTCSILPSCTYRAYFHRESLSSERILSRELGYVAELPGGTFDLKYSYDRLDQLLDTQVQAFPGTLVDPRTGRAAAGLQFANLGAASVRSLEAQWQQRLGAATRLHVAWAATRITPRTDVSAMTYKDSAPFHSRSALLAHDFDSRLGASLAYYQTGALSVQGDGDFQPAHERVDARLAYRFGSGKNQGELALVVQNLLNKPYQEIYYENLIGRRTYINLRLEF